MTVFVDNIRITGRLRGGDDKVNEVVPITNIAGVEIYPRAINAPAAYQPYNGNCGVVLIWTK
jgi:hypothetical protein